MRLLNLKASNIFSLGSVELPLHDRGLVLVSGYSFDEGSSNGAGKSSLANKAILWALFGRTNQGAIGDSVCNRHVQGVRSSASVEFIGVDGQNYKVVRTRNPAACALYQWADNEYASISNRSAGDTQQTINLLLGRDFDTFVQSEFFGQGRTSSLFELPPAEQKRLLESILPFDQLGEWIENCKKAKAKVVAKIDERHNAFLEARTTHQVIQKQYDTISDQHKKHDQLENEKRIEAYKKYQRAEEQYKMACVLPMAGEEGEPQARLNDLNERRWMVEAELRATRKAIKDPVCPTCGRKQPDDFLAQVEVLIEKEKRALKEIAELGTKIELTSNEVQKLKAREVMDQAKLVYDQVEVTENPFGQTVERLEKELEQARESLQKASEGMDSIRVDRHAVDLWDRALRTDLRALMIEEACPFLEARTNKYLAELGNPQIQAKFSNKKKLKSGETKNEFSATVSSKSGGSEFDLLSGGEQQLTGFAAGLALSDLAASQAEGSSDILILDEPFMALDPRNCENVVNFLTGYLSKRKSTILLISNEPELQELVPTAIKVVKRNGVSTLEEDNGNYS